MKYIIHYKVKDYSTIRDAWWHGYAENADAAKAALLADPLSPKIEKIIDITEVNQLKHFKVLYTNGQYYYTQANGTAAEFEAYLKQDGGRITLEDSNGQEFHLWIDRVEEIQS